VQICARSICFPPSTSRPGDIQNLQKKNVRQWCGQRAGRLYRPSTATVTRKHAVKNANRTASPVRFSKEKRQSRAALNTSCVSFFSGF